MSRIKLSAAELNALVQEVETVEIGYVPELTQAVTRKVDQRTDLEKERTLARKKARQIRREARHFLR